jgi:plastocyanin
MREKTADLALRLRENDTRESKGLQLDRGRLVVRIAKRCWAIVALCLPLPVALAANHTVIVGQNNAGQPALAFNPSSLTINAGDMVTFTNAGGTHNVDSTSGPTTFKCSVNCTTTNTPNMTAWSATVTFPTAGTVTYQCDQHVGFGMVGSITVNPLVPVRLQSFDVD